MFSGLKLMSMSVNNRRNVPEYGGYVKEGARVEADYGYGRMFSGLKLMKMSVSEKRSVTE